MLHEGDLILHVEELDQQLMSSVVSTVGKYVDVSTAASPSHQQKARSVTVAVLNT